MISNASVRFFDAQFERQVRDGEFALNPFELAALPWLRGDVLDYGCGLGNLSLHAARLGHRVLALDASPAAIGHLKAAALRESLPLIAEVADLRTHELKRDFDTVVSIGLLMFFDRVTALRQLDLLIRSVRPGGVAIVNVLIEGTSFLGMFDPSAYCLFGPDEVAGHFAQWKVRLCEEQDFAAPGGTIKRFSTVIAERPG